MSHYLTASVYKYNQAGNDKTSFSKIMFSFLKTQLSEEIPYEDEI